MSIKSSCLLNLVCKRVAALLRYTYSLVKILKRHRKSQDRLKKFSRYCRLHYTVTLFLSAREKKIWLLGFKLIKNAQKNILQGVEKKVPTRLCMIGFNLYKKHFKRK